jgi:hypothetical protein
MKKILLSFVIFASAGIAYQSYGQAQLCGAGNIIHWTGAGDSGDMGSSPAGSTALPANLFKIDGSSTLDWDYWISGAFLYSGSPKSQMEPTPYGTPLQPANVQVDGLKAGTIANSNYDRDAVGQDHRDLRYFAFTYDKANIYFFFRRPQNNTAQVSLYYFIDINVDGWMSNGEPVIQLTFNNSGSSIIMGYYEAALPNGIPASAYDATKGNIMTAPTSRVKTNNTSEWEVGSADGWSMPGTFKTFNNGVNPPTLGSVDGIAELFNAATLTDNHSDGTDAGYGVEFVVPWSYFRKYTAAGSNGPGLTYSSIFTWHVSLVSGQSGLSGAEDNAGGCCAGLGVSGSPLVTKSSSWGAKPGGTPPYDYRLSITYTNQKNYPTIIKTVGFQVIDPKDANGIAIPEDNIKNWKIAGYKNADCAAGNETNADSTNFYYVGKSGTTYTFAAYDFAKAGVTAASGVGQTACYYIDINAFSWPPLKSTTLSYSFSTEFDISSTTCDNIQGGGSSENLDVLPVKMTYFNAVRNGKDVNLAWETSIEDNNTGFEVQRFLGANGWQNIGFVSSKAINGNSGTPLNYQFTDFNNTTKGITQYRLKQVDKGNRSSYSLIRSVRGDGQKGKTIIYPNPTSDGKVNIIFEDMNGIRDVSVSDVSGRVVKQMRGVTNNNITIDNLSAGFYTVRIVNNETGEQVVEKFVVNKR